jgi:hypothetical protein
MKRALIILALALAAFAVPTSSVRAANWMTDDCPDSILNAVSKGTLSGCAYTGFVQNSTFVNVITNVLGGVEGLNLPVGASKTNPEVVAELNSRSAIRGINHYIAMIYANPPASTYAFARDMGETLGFVPKSANAQGIGFSGLTPLLPIWKAFRNIAYALLAVVMVVIGFMVMFRQKIDPKTVVTVQNALPRIVVALLLITFSYAIVGILIDLMYVVMLGIVSIIVANSNGLLGADTTAKYLTASLGTTFSALFGGGLSSVDDIVTMIFYPQSNQVASIISHILDFATLGVAFLGRYLVVGLIVTIALIFGFIRLLFMLLSAYIQIIIALLTAPLQLMTEALPGSKSFENWLKNLISNLSVFPITAAMLLIGTMLTQYENVSGGTMWIPPFLGSPYATGGGNSTDMRGITALIGLGILLTIPNVANSIKESLKAKPAVNAGLGAVFGPMGAGAGQAMQLGYQVAMIKGGFQRKADTTPSEGLQEASKKGMSPGK